MENIDSEPILKSYQHKFTGDVSGDFDDFEKTLDSMCFYIANELHKWLKSKFINLIRTHYYSTDSIAQEKLGAPKKAHEDTTEIWNLPLGQTKHLWNSPPKELNKIKKQQEFSELVKIPCFAQTCCQQHKRKKQFNNYQKSGFPIFSGRSSGLSCNR